MSASTRPIGVFDSGLGGISVLREAVRLMPQESFVYFGDNAHAPYGERGVKEIRALLWLAMLRFLEQDVKAVVLACNTATSAAADFLRQNLSVPVIGMEPALKPASQYKEYGSILVLATQNTIRLPKFQHLMRLYGEGAIGVPCPGLVNVIEQGELSGERLNDCLAEYLLPYKDIKVGAVVLGCTHYCLIRDAIKPFFPFGTPLVDGNIATGRRLIHQMKEQGMLKPAVFGGPKGSVTLTTSGDKAVFLPLMEKLLNNAN